MPEPKNGCVSPQDTLTGCLLRIGWMVAGNLALFLAAVYIAQATESRLSVADLAFWAIVVLLVGVRYVDIAKFKGQTASSEPATLAHWRRYVGLLFVVSLAVWGLAHGVAYLAR